MSELPQGLPAQGVRADGGVLAASATAKRLLFVTAEPHPTFRADVRVLFGKYLLREGIGTDLFTQAAPDDAAAVWPAGRVFLAPPTRNKWIKQWVMLRHDCRLFGLARQGYAAVQVRDRMFAGAIALWAARRAGIPFFYWASYPKPESRRIVANQLGGLRQPLRWLANQIRGHLGGALLYRVVLQRADHVFVQSAAMLSAFAERGIPVEKMTAVPMGVDLEAVQSARAPSADWLARLRERRVVVYVGALDKVRQPGLMVEAMTRVRQRCPQALLLMVGGAPEAADMAALQAQVKRLRLEQHVCFTGWLSPDEAMGFMAQADLGLSMYPRGPLFDVCSPTKLAEYFALGLPVVANDLPDQAEVIANSHAGRCVPFTAEALADAITATLNHPDLARAQGMAGQRYIEANRSYAALAHRLVSIYRRLLG